MPALVKAIDSLADEYCLINGFDGLLCLAHDGIRNEILVVTLWNEDGREATEALSEANRHRIAATTGLGVCTRRYEVLCQTQHETLHDGCSEKLWTDQAHRRQPDWG